MYRESSLDKILIKKKSFFEKHRKKLVLSGLLLAIVVAGFIWLKPDSEETVNPALVKVVYNLSTSEVLEILNYLKSSSTDLEEDAELLDNLELLIKTRALISPDDAEVIKRVLSRNIASMSTIKLILARMGCREAGDRSTWCLFVEEILGNAGLITDGKLIFQLSEEVLDMSIGELYLERRYWRALKSKVNTVYDILSKKPSEIQKIRWFGDKGMQDLLTKLTEAGVPADFLRYWIRGDENLKRPKKVEGFLD